MRILLIGLFASLLTASVSQAQYCAAIRGNGQLAPAHWSAMSRVVEENGMPKAMAGGSSATVSMFFIESIKMSQAVTATDAATVNKQQALLLKSLPVYLNIFAETEDVKSVLKFVTDLQDPTSGLNVGLAAAAVATGNGAAIASGLAQYGPLLNAEILKGLLTNTAQGQAQLSEALSVFGKFNAATDDNIFFRPGLIDFKQFAIELGKIADFYAGNVSPAVLGLQQHFVNSCSEDYYQTMFPAEDELVYLQCLSVVKKADEEDPSYKKCKDLVEQGEVPCAAKFAAAVNLYLQETKDNPTLGQRVFEPIGQSVDSFPITAVLTGTGFQKYFVAKQQFDAFVPSDYGSFSVDESSIEYGYWGPTEASLKNLETKLKAKTGDLKSQKFKSLGHKSTWFDALATSPAEPGLANFQFMTEGTTAAQVLAEVQKPIDKKWTGLNYYKDRISAGGWPDLHPTQVLKAHGCDEIVYFTREGRASTFGQHVYVRLAGLQDQVPFWTKLGSEADETRDMTERSNATAVGTTWDQLYGFQNKQSSYNQSFADASAVYCTNWDNFDVFAGQMNEALFDSYVAPVILNDATAAHLQVNPNRFAGQQVSGCMPPQ